MDRLMVLIIATVAFIALGYWNPYTCSGTRITAIKEERREAYKHEHCERMFPFDFRERQRQYPAPSTGDDDE
jgi:hypothetical protein